MIRELTEDDAEELAALYLVNRAFLAPFEPQRDDEFFTAEGQRRRLAKEQKNAYRFGIFDDAGALAGIINLNDVVRGPLQMAHVGYWVDESHNGQGLATQAVADVVAFAFGEAGLHRLEAGTLPDNIASQRVLEKNGFTKFGYATKLLLLDDGTWHDHVLFELVAG